MRDTYRSRPRILVLLLCLMTLCITSSGLEAQQVTNTTCPVLTGEEIDPNIWVEYEGKKVFFCCMMCRKNFLTDPEKYIPNLPQFAENKAGPGEGIDDEGMGHTVPGVDQHEDEEQTGTSQGMGDMEFDQRHEHEEGGKGQKNIGAGVTLLGRFHPVVIHFPIALILTAALAELLRSLQRRNSGLDFFGVAVRYLLPLAALSSVVAMFFGLAAVESMHFPQALKGYVEWHEILGFVTTGLIVITTGMHEWNRRKGATWTLWAYRIAIVLTSISVIVTGHLGGTLVFGPDHFSI